MMTMVARQAPAALAGFLLVVGTSALPPSRLSAQSLREFSSTRQYRGEPRLTVHLDYTGGSLEVRPADQGTLYRLRLTYDEERYEAVDDFNPGSGDVRLGLAARARGAVRVSTRASALQRATAVLSPRAALDLQVRLGAATAELDLSGLRLARLAFEGGASQARIQFTTPNPIRCDVAELRSGAAELEAIGLGHARCNQVRFLGGGGRITLDFGGTWSGTMQVKGEMAIGALVLRIPRSAGVRLKLDRFLSSFAPQGLTRSEDGTLWTSSSWSTAAEKLDLEVDTAVGGVTVEWRD